MTVASKDLGWPSSVSILRRRISGGAASDKNIKENVCAQIEKNFARAKWKVSPGRPRVSQFTAPRQEHRAV